MEPDEKAEDPHLHNPTPAELDGIAAPPRRSLWQLLGDLKSDSVELCKKEAQLAALEMKQNASRATLLVGLIVGGALAAFAGLIVTLMGFASLLSMAFGADSSDAGPAAGGQLVIGLLIAIAGSVTSYLCVKRLPNQALSPKKTIASIKEDLKKVKNELK